MLPIFVEEPVAVTTLLLAEGMVANAVVLKEYILAATAMVGALQGGELKAGLVCHHGSIAAASEFHLPVSAVLVDVPDAIGITAAHVFQE